MSEYKNNFFLDTFIPFFVGLASGIVLTLSIIIIGGRI